MHVLTLAALLGLSDSDVVAIGGLGAFIATIGLAIVAVFQARQMRAQVVAIRETAESQINAVRLATDEQLKLVRAQVDASIQQTDTLRELTMAQARPAVVVRPVSDWIVGPGTAFNLRPREAVLPYYLSNEGPGIALNVTHGAHVAKGINAHGLGPSVFAIRPGESFPRAENNTERQPAELLQISLYADEIPEHLRTWPIEFWVRCQDAFGQSLESSFHFTQGTLRHAIAMAGIEPGASTAQHLARSGEEEAEQSDVAG